MGLIQAFKKKLLEMAEEDIRRGNVVLERAKAPEPAPEKDEAQSSKGIALLMVIAAVSTLSFLVTEFTYVAQLNQKLAYDELDQVKAVYLAKSGFKLSLLRLKAYRTVKNLLASQGGAGGAAAVPASTLNKIWSFPFAFPIPTTLPGMTTGDKDAINKFQKESGFEGSYTAMITSESSRLNLNMILAGFQPSAQASPSPSPSPSQSPTSPQTPNPNPNPTPSPSPSFDPEAARKSLQDYLQSILQNKYEEDPDFQSEYRDFRIEDFMDNLVTWADPSYERKQAGMGDHIAFKRAPFYSITEFHMLPGIDDQLYELFTPNLTVSRTPGVNVNSIQAPVLRALVPQMTDQEVKDFFTFRDDPEQDNQFKDADAFFKYLSNSVAAFKSDDAMNKLKTDFQKRNIRIVTDETEFKITIRATVNQSVRTLEAWVALTDDQGSKSSTNKPQGSNPTPTPSPTPSQTTPDAGLKINFMRIL